MIGGILGFATSMVAWQATAMAVKEGAKWAASTARRSIVKYARYAESARNTRGTRTARHIFDRVSKVEPRLGSRNLTEQTIRTTTAAYRNRMSAAVRRRVLSKQTPKVRKALTVTGKAIGDEISVLPATYVMYRLEKHTAVSPEEKETTASFSKWYLGAPMAFSIGINAALRAKQKGTVKRTTMKVAKKYSRQTRSVVKTGMRGLKHISSEHKYNIADKAIALSRARRMTTENRGLLSLVGSRRPSDIYKHIKNHYKEELPRVKHLREHRLTAIDKQMDKLHETIVEMRAGKKYSTIEPAEKKQYSSETREVMRQVRSIGYQNYEKEVNKRSRILNFVNEVLENAGSTDLQIRRKTARRSTQSGTKDMPLDPSLYSYRGEDFDMGNLSMSSIKDSLIKRAGKGIPQFALSLFGQGDMINYLHSEHAMGSAFRIGRSGSRIYFPHALSSDPLQRESPSDIILSMMGTTASTATRAQRDTASQFLDTRYKLYMKEGMSRGAASNAMKVSANRGELWLAADDILLHSPGGKMGIISKNSKDNKPMFINMGGAPGGKMLDYLQFSSQTNSIGSKLYRNWLGSERYEYFDKIGKVNRHIQLGPTPIERIKDQVEVSGTMGGLRKVLKKFEIGYSQEQSIFSKVAGLMKKHGDPRYTGTLFSKDYLRSERWIDEMLKTDRSIEEFGNIIRGEAKDASDYFWHNMIRKAGGMKRMRPTFKKHSENLPVSMNEFLIYDDQTVSQAKANIDSLHDFLIDISTEKSDKRRLYSWLRDDIKEVKMMQRRFHDNDIPDQKLFDLLGDKFDTNSVTIAGRNRKPTAIDSYNATVFRITTAVMQSIPEEFVAHKFPKHISGEGYREQVTNALDQMFTDSVYNVTKQKERSAYEVSKRLGKVYQDISGSFSEIHPAISENDRAKIVGSIKSSVRHFIGDHTELKPDIDYVVDYHKSRKLKYSAAAPWNFDTRPKVGQPDYDEIFLMPKTWNTGPINKRQIKVGPDQTIDIAEGIMDASNVGMMSMFHAFNRTASEFLGIGLDETLTTTPRMYLKKMFTKRVAPVIGISMAYSVVNRMADEYLDGTIFGEGIGVFGANIIAGARVAAQGMLDVTGGTETAAYLEDLMPGSITSPLSGLVRGIGPMIGGVLAGARFGPRAAITGGGIGGAVGMLLGGGPLGVFGLHDISKSRKQVVEELIGEREVPIRKARFWELGAQDFHGGRVQYFRPHMYAMLRSDYQHAPGYKDSLMTEMVGSVAPDIYAMKNYYSRPYPATAGLFSDIPVFSNMMHMIPGSDMVTGTGISMHQDELEVPMGAASTGYSMGQAAQAGLGIDSISAMYKDKQGLYGFAEGGANAVGGGDINTLLAPTPMEMGSAEHAIGNTITNMQDIVGLRGFIGSSIFGSITGRSELFDYAPELASPIDIAGIRQSYWEMELGGLAGLCLADNTPIETQTKVKKAEDILVGDSILSKDGKYRPVKRIFKRKLDDNKLYDISYSGINRPLSISGNHKLPIYRNQKCVKTNTTSCCKSDTKHKCIDCAFNIKTTDPFTNSKIIDIPPHTAITNNYYYTACRQEFAEVYEYIENNGTDDIPSDYPNRFFGFKPYTDVVRHVLDHIKRGWEIKRHPLTCKLYEKNTVDTLKKGDYLLRAIPVVNNFPNIVIDLGKYVPDTYCITDNYIYRKGLDPNFIKAVEYFENNPDMLNKSVKEMSILLNVSPIKITTARTHFMLKKESKRWNRYLEINEDFAYFIGWYLAEGYSSVGKEICLALNSNEIEYATHLKTIITGILGVNVYIDIDNEHHTLVLRFSHPPLSYFLKAELGTYCYNKRLSSYLWTNNKSTMLSYIKGLFFGDGTITNTKNNKGNGCSLKTTSESLAFLFHTILSTFGIVSTIFIEYPKDRRVVYKIAVYGYNNILFRNLFGIPISTPPKDIRRLKKIGSKDGVFIKGNYIHYRISNITTKYYNRWVYDFEVEKVHYYHSNLICICNSEVIRRYVPHSRNQIDVFNPHVNTMPDWLCGSEYYVDFRHGDPFAAVPMGEARLPGPSYESLHNIDLSMPLEADILGEELDSQMAFYLGLPEYMSHKNRLIDMVEPVKKDIELAARRYGSMVKGETHLYEPSINLHAQADAIVKDASGEKVPIKIVPRGIAGEASINAFMVLSDVEKGLLIEVDTETGDIAQRIVNKDIRRFQADIERTKSAAVASYGSINQLEEDGKAMNLANAYSWFDRFKILADVAQYSDSYKVAEAIVDQQMASGRLNDRTAEYQVIKDQIREKQKALDFDEYRFSNIGKSITEYGKAKDEFHQDNYSYLEQQIGTLWERASHFRSPVHTKLLHQSSAMEEYERSVMYGKGVKLWEQPGEDFLASYYHLARGEKDPLQGFSSWGVGGYLLGGGPVGLAMGAAGAGVSMWNRMSGSTYIPDRVAQRRDVMEQMDAVKYAKFKNLFQQTGDSEYLDKANRTMTSTSMQNQILSPISTAWNIGGPDKYYIEDIINNVTTENIDRVRDMLPETAVASLYQAMGDEKLATFTMGKFAERQMERELPDITSTVYSPDVPIESPLIETLEQRGVTAHDAGVGWYRQMATLQRSKQLGIYKDQDLLYPDAFQGRVTVKDFDNSLTDTGQLRNLLLQFSTNVSIIEDGQSRIELEIVGRS